MYNFNEPFRLRKRFRNAEENQFPQSRAVPWNKNIIDLEYGTYLGRTPKRWLYLMVFYVAFYTALILLWTASFYTFRSTVPDDGPKWFIKQPGFSFEPFISSEGNVIQIEYHQKQEEEIYPYIDRIENKLRKYGSIPRDDYFGDCRSEQDFGYKNKTPCIFLKINRIVGFKSQTIELPYDLPVEAPPNLYSYIANLSEDERKARIWVACQSRPSHLMFAYIPQPFYEASVVQISQLIEHKASVEYIDTFGKENSRFYNALDFKRIIAVRLLNVTVNIKYMVLCSLWAKNIERDVLGKMGHGLVRFNLQIKSEAND